MTTASGLERYRAEGFERTEGWVNPKALGLVEAIDEAQSAFGVEGGVMEVGVYRGRFFMALNSLVADGHRSIAIDLFDDQALNIDGSGQGDLTVFRSNLEQWDRHGGRNVEIMSADSTRVEAETVLARLGSRPRIVSVDGGHTPEHTLSDIRLAQAVLHPRGVVFVDDIMNANWIGVIEGVVTYLSQKPTMWPFALGFNKLLMCPMSVHSKYLEWVRSNIEGAKKHVRLCGYDLFNLR